MRCPSCEAGNPPEASRCAACGGNLRRPARQGNAPHDTLAWAAYRTSLWSLVPVTGVVLGPVAFALGLVAWWRGRRNPADRGIGPALAAMILGGSVGVTNAVGLYLMARGLGWVG